MAATQNKQTWTVAWLLKQRADVNIQNDKNLTALHLAARNGDIETTRELVRHGAKPQLTDKDGLTAVQNAAEGHGPQIAYAIAIGQAAMRSTGALATQEPEPQPAVVDLSETEWPLQEQAQRPLPNASTPSAASVRASVPGVSELARLPAVGARVEVFSQSSCRWEVGEVVQHVGRTRHPNSTDSDVKVVYQGGRGEIVVNALDASVFRLVEERDESPVVVKTGRLQVQFGGIGDFMPMQARCVYNQL